MKVALNGMHQAVDVVPGGGIVGFAELHVGGGVQKLFVAPCLPSQARMIWRVVLIRICHTSCFWERRRDQLQLQVTCWECVTA